MTITVGTLRVTIHRTVRVPEGRAPANLPPSLGRAQVYRVADRETFAGLESVFATEEP